ncbi:hypothetical protein L207DRAFT_270344 [Hyaloscypha variabilis F]|uniref:Uncharacterized protein n=1 Tax=Hyaloscypha variabilis (strain UAMH 11265 / GT02V1 / F) TaxID=1149755 RepID=A0A2J6RZW6_HYAVF|nr:hypothetical protein L207DRAFT_270344 [Hyaloscypha variabilis F]
MLPSHSLELDAALAALAIVQSVRSGPSPNSAQRRPHIQLAVWLAHAIQCHPVPSTPQRPLTPRSSLLTPILSFSTTHFLAALDRGRCSFRSPLKLPATPTQLRTSGLVRAPCSMF